MSCTQPLRAFYTGLLTDNHKELLYVSKNNQNKESVRVELAEKALGVKIPMNKEYVILESGYRYLYKYVDVPCGKCLSCKNLYSRDWAVRCSLEAKYSKNNYFLTLTFSDDFLPQRVDRKDITMFMKRLRNKLGVGVRFFACGETGEKSNRPHYHLILFNCPLNDFHVLRAEPLSMISDTISEIWPYGNHMIMPFNEAAAAYVARYTNKKTSEHFGFIQMSRRPGIGFRYFQDNKDRLFMNDSIIYKDGDDLKTSRLPRFFVKQFDKLGYDYSVQTENHVESAKIQANKDIYRHKVGDLEGLRAFNRFQDRLKTRKERKL